jgi:hypothetical protein
MLALKKGTEKDRQQETNNREGELGALLSFSAATLKCGLRIHENVRT